VSPIGNCSLIAPLAGTWSCVQPTNPPSASSDVNMRFLEFLARLTLRMPPRAAIGSPSISVLPTPNGPRKCHGPKSRLSEARSGQAQRDFEHAHLAEYGRPGVAAHGPRMGVSRGPDTTVLDFFFFALCAATTSDTSSIIMTITLFMVMSFMVTREKKKFPNSLD
jgi:hypothetical protein